MKVLVGSTGLVGTTLQNSVSYDLLFNSKNIHTFTNQVQNGAELTLACLPATKWKVDADLKSDLDNIWKIINILTEKTYSRINLISTIDVYPTGIGNSYTEVRLPPVLNLSYGTNRYLFELYVKSFLKATRICTFRLPALFSSLIKKNVLFDLLHENRVEFIKVNSSYQWYFLEKLANDLEYFPKKFPTQDTFNLFSEPVPVQNLVEMFPSLLGKVDYDSEGIHYSHRTICFKSGYIQSKEQTLAEIKKFVNDFRSK
jgi:hypothetical protein